MYVSTYVFISYSCTILRLLYCLCSRRFPLNDPNTLEPGSGKLQARSLTYSCYRSDNAEGYPCPQHGHDTESSQNYNTSPNEPQRVFRVSEEREETHSDNNSANGQCHVLGSPVIAHISEYIDQDPLQDDEILMQGPRIADKTDADANAIKKVPSDQALSKFRWGSNQRTSGRSKSGLQILVPGRKTSTELITGGPVTGKSIIYAYASSGSSSGRTTHSFGAVGDHLPSARSVQSSSSGMPAIPEDQSTRQENCLKTARSSNALSPLANLVRESDPDQDPYDLMIVGETGPCRRQVTPQIVAPSSLRSLRRRSLSDLIEPRLSFLSQTGQPIPNSLVPQGTLALEGACYGGTQCSKKENIARSFDATSARCKDAPPVWYRAGRPFPLKANRLNHGSIELDSKHRDLDPAMFSLPYGVSKQSAAIGIYLR